MRTVFLDLDGTLTDPAEGITSALNYALENMGYPRRDPAELCRLIGPPLEQAFIHLGVEDTERAILLYREEYMDTGLFQNVPYPGILDALREMKERGRSLVLMTAKPHLYARRITAHFGIAPFMHAEYGPEMDGTRKNKWDLLAHALKEMQVDPAQSVMVGDRSHDFLAAARNGMPSIGVRWGYGSDAELSQANVCCDRVSDLPGKVLQLLP